MMGGQIGLISTVGMGSTFWFTVDLAKAKGVPEVIPMMDAKASGDLWVSYAADLKILLVEDNVVNQKVARKMFQRLGLDANVANDEVEALSATT